MLPGPLPPGHGLLWRLRPVAGTVFPGLRKQAAQAAGHSPGAPDACHYGVDRFRGVACGDDCFMDGRRDGRDGGIDHEETSTYRTASPGGAGPVDSQTVSRSPRSQGPGSGVSGHSFMLWSPWLDGVETGDRTGLHFRRRSCVDARPSPVDRSWARLSRKLRAGPACLCPARFSPVQDPGGVYRLLAKVAVGLTGTGLRPGPFRLLVRHTRCDHLKALHPTGSCSTNQPGLVKCKREHRGDNT